jgi:hypothetical protein
MMRSTISGDDVVLADRVFRNFRDRSAVAPHSSHGEVIHWLKSKNKYAVYSSKYAMRLTLLLGSWARKFRVHFGWTMHAYLLLFVCLIFNLSAFYILRTIVPSLI